MLGCEDKEELLVKDTEQMQLMERSELYIGNVISLLTGLSFVHFYSVF